MPVQCGGRRLNEAVSAVVWYSPAASTGSVPAGVVEFNQRWGFARHVKGVKVERSSDLRCNGND